MDFLTDPIFTDFSRSDFIGGIDNEALDFGQLEQFIHVTASTGGGGNVSPTVSSVDVNDVLATTSTNISTNSSITQTQSHLPESPPDSGSEPPFSPVDLQGLTLTSRATSNCAATSTNDNNPLIDNDSQLGARHHVKPSTDLHALTQHIPGAANQHHNHNQQQQHQHNHNLHQHHIYVDQNDQHSLLLAASPHMHQQSLHHADAHGPSASPNGQTSNGLYSPDSRHDRCREHSDNLLAIDRHQHHQQPHSSNNHLHVPSMNDIMDMEQHRSPYSRQMMMMPTPHQQHAPSMIPSDVYMGTPGPLIEPTSTPVPPPTRKRKLSQVDCCASMMAVKPEPAPSLSPMCQQKLNPTSPVSINLQQIGASGGGSSGVSVSPTSSSLSPTATSLSLSQDNNSIDGNGVATPNGSGFVGSNNNDSSSESLPMQCIRFSPFQQHNWHTLCDQSLQELTMAHYRVDADKGFNFSVSDDAFVCQKKNHFQITCHARLQGDAKFVRTPSGLEKIKSFHLHFYGVKLEAPNQIIRVEQSQSDRSKKPFYPVPIDLQSHLVSKVTVGRLHFSETTNNNMRKKGRPNPEQRYFQLVVGLHVHTHSGHFPVVSQGSERIIVRASNPGQFESDVELCWQRGITPESIFHAGRVGINTDRPDESLVIHGNLKVSGHIIQPSDSRAKQEISELDTALQLRNLQKIRIVRYRYEPEFAMHSGLKSEKDNEEIVDTGVIAQEVREVLPDAVQEAGSIVLPSGQIIENFLLVNKDRILMENIGAVKELCKVTGSLETRIEQLEKINNRLMRMQEIDRSKKKCKHLLDDRMLDGEDELCSNRTIQMMIIILVIIMATCLVAVSTLYFMEHSKQRYMKHYDRYDISHHLVSHDSILINNNNNQRNLNHNGYHTNKNGKLIVHAHTSRPPLAPPIPPPIQPQFSSNYALLSHNNMPASVIPEPYPAVGIGDGSAPAYPASSLDSDIFDSIRNVKNPIDQPIEDLSLGLEKPALPFLSNPATTISHTNNKTVNSKNKLKWPLAETTITVTPPVTVAYNFNDDPIEESLNTSETSSEKVADSIPLPQDFENNSIDGTDVSQKRETREGSHGNVDQSIDHEPIIGSTTQNDDHHAPESNVLGVTAESAAIVAAIGVGSGKLVVTNGDPTSPSSSSSSSASLSSSSIAVVYKNVQAKKMNDTISQQVNFTIETPPITNKSHGIDTEDADLQYLGNGNDSDDQNLSESGAAQVITKLFALPPIGLPDHCAKIKREEISNCQSTCFEDTNSLSSQNSESEIRRRHIQLLASDNATSLTSPTGNVASAASGIGPNGMPFQKPQSLIDESADSTVSLERIHVDSEDDDDNTQTGLSKSQIVSQHQDDQEDIALSLKDKKISHKDCKRKVDSIAEQTIVERKASTECSSITPWLQADTFNVSLGCEEICLSNPTSLNITYKIPLSKYLKDTNVELHFVAPANLHWTVCSNKEKTKRDGNSIINPLTNGKLFQKNQNVSIFYLIIPDHGHFERLIELRAAMDSTKNLCREQADETKVLIQYNIRIVRDCD